MTDTIGKQLKEARLARNLSIEAVSRATRIRVPVLIALEADDFDSLSSTAQVRGFLRLYASHLGLSLDEILSRQRLASSGEPPQAASPSAALPPPVSPAADQTRPSRRKSPSHKEEKTDVETRPSAESQSATSVETVSPPQPSSSTARVSSSTGIGASREDRSSPPPALTRPSAQVFSSIGSSLRERREGLGLSLDEIERHTRVRRHYLEALEQGDFDRLPSSVQARGMLTNYARFLDLDSEALLLEFAGGLQARLAERQPAPAITQTPGPSSPRKIALPASLRRFLSPDILFGGGMILVLVIFAVWGTGRIIRSNAAASPQPDILPISDILLSTPIPGELIATGTSMDDADVAAGQGTTTLEITLLPPSDRPVQVVLVASRNTWVKVVVDFVVVIEGRAMPGTAYTFDADTQVEVVTGDGSAVSIIYNSTNLGAMGDYGEVVDRIYTASGILVPTVTFTPSPTISQTPTITPRPSITPVPSNTPRRSPTPEP